MHTPEEEKAAKASKGGGKVNASQEGQADTRKCFVCKKPLSDKAAHPNGNFCPRKEKGGKGGGSGGGGGPASGSKAAERLLHAI